MAFQDQQDDPAARIERDRQRLQRALQTGVALNPDTVATDRREAAARGMPTESFVAAREQGVPVPPPGWDRLPEHSPMVSSFLADPGNAAVAHDDIETMSGVERVIRGIGSRTARLTGSLARTDRTLFGGVEDFTRRQLDRAGVPIFDWRTDAQGRVGLQRVRPDEQGRTRTTEAIRATEGATFGYEAGTTWEQVKADPIRNIMPFAIESGLVSLPDMAAAIAALPVYVAARTGEIGQQRAGNDQRQDATVGDLIEALPAAAGSALLERIGARGIIGLDDVVRGGARGILPAAGRAGAKEGITEGLQSALEYAGGTLGTEAGFDVREMSDQVLAGVVAGTPFGAVVRTGTATVEVATGRFGARAASAQTGEEGAAQLEQLAALAEASKLRERAPETFQQFVDQASEGTPVEDIYVDAEVFAQTLNTAGLTTEEVTAAIPSLAEQLPAALATGGDLRISAGEFAAHIAGTDAAAPLLDHLRTDPFSMSRAQAGEFLKTQGEELQAEVEKAAAEAVDAESFRASADAVRTRIVEELNTTGRFTADVNKGYASLVANFYATTGARLGLTAEEMADRYALKFSAQLPGGERRTMDQPEEVDLVHYSDNEGLTMSDPQRWGATRATQNSERERRNAGAPGRTYFGVRGVYQGESGVGINRRGQRYAARVPADRLYDFDADPQNLRPSEGTPAEIATAYERAIQEAGFAGYRSDAVVPGAVAVFEPVALTDDRVFAQSPVVALEGAPKTNQPYAPARIAAAEYMAAAGLPYDPPARYVKVDPERAARIAQAFEDMKHDPADPEVAAAYRAMIDETLAQYQVIKATGLSIDFITDDNPYASSPREAIKDVVENNHLWVFPTDEGFGSSDADVSGNPLLEMTDEYIGERQLKANDVFRIVHDYFGHVKDGNGFRADGEENAWRSHAAMYSPAARRAMTTETRGQNSWVNYGPKGETNRTASAENTVYADQKIGLLPEWVSEEGLRDEGQQVFNQSDVFYSALQRAVENSPTTKAPAVQWKATLAKTPGVKKEEIEWSGINDWLDGITEPEVGVVNPDAKGNVSKEAVLAFLNAGGVRVEERVLGFEPDNSGRYITPSEDGEGYDLLDAQGNLIQSFEDEGEAEWTLNGGETPAQFSTYKLPGADDTYRELLLTLPNIEGPSTHWDEPNVIAHTRFTERQDADGKRVLFLEELQSDWHQKGRDEGYRQAPDPVRAQETFDAWQAAQDAHTAAAKTFSDAVAAQLDADLIATNQALTEAEDKEMSEEYRLNLRIGINEMLTALTRLHNEIGIGEGNAVSAGRIASSLFRRSREGGLMMRRPDALVKLRLQLEDAGLQETEARVAMDAAFGANGIPDAPFRTSWSALVMKRMIRYAADNGYDKIAWINGNQQNGGQTGGDGSFFYERNLVNVTNDLLKKYGTRVEPVDMIRDEPGSPRRDYVESLREQLEIERVDLERSELESRIAEITRPNTRLGIQNGFEITDELREAARQGFALFQPNRGQIAFGQDIAQTPSVISLLRTADLSTFLHETGHFFLEVTTHIANDPAAPADILSDLSAVFDWFEPGMTLERWNKMGQEERRPYHEKFARGFEAYLFEGRSPSTRMGDLFRRFSAWLKNVYRDLTALNVTLTDEVRGVMDRMLASQEEIAAAEQARSFAPLFATRPEGMTEDEWSHMQRLGSDATAEAIEQLEQRSARDMRWASGAKDRYVKSLQREAEEQRKSVRAEVTAEVMGEPVNRARSFLRRGLDENGEPMENAAKLDLATLKELYGEEGEWAKLRRGGKYGEVATEGLHPDVVADMFGYASGEQLIADLVNGENAADKIKGLTDQRMLERYGDLADERAIERAANEAVANEARAKFVAAESAALHKAIGKRSILNSAAREFAAGVVNRLELKRLRPAQYLAAQGRAAVAAAKAFAKDDIVGAATAKRNQLINLHTGRAVQQAQKDVEKTMRLFTRIVNAKDDSISRSRNMDLVNAARAVLSMYGIGRVKNDPTSYMEAVKRYDPTLYADIEPFINGARGDAKPILDLTYEQFQSLRDTVNQMWNLSRRSKQIEIDGKLMDRAVVTEALGAKLEELGLPEQAGLDRAPTDKDRVVRYLLGTRAALRRVESWARGIDGVDAGPFRRFVWNPISEAADRYRAESGDYIRRFRDLLDTVRDELKPKDIAAPEIGYTFGGKSELYHALLHTGNGSNKSKLLLGRRWGKKDADGALDDTQWSAFIDRLHAEGVLTAKDWTFIQSVWDLLETTKGGAQRAHHAIYGRYFDEVSADAFDTPFGELRGGYVPALTDAFLVQDAVLRAEQEAIEGGDSAMFPAASNGFTKSRVEDYTRELALDLRLLPMHIDKVLKFTHLGPPVRDVARILKDRGFSAKLQQFDPTAATDLLLPWLQRAAKQIVETPMKGSAGKAADKFFSALRSRVGMQLMFGNVLNTAQQVATGWAPAMLRVGKGPMSAALWRYVRNPKGVAEAATSLSPFLTNRANTDLFEARQAITQLTKLNPNVKDEAVAFMTRHTYFMQAAVQNVFDVVIWSAAYDQATAKGEDQMAAVRYADSVIRETQGSMAPEDISRFETGTPFVRMFTQFAGYFNMMANLNATEVQLVARGVGLKKGMGRLFYVYLMGFAIPAVIGDAVMKIGRGGWEDEEDDGYMDDLLTWFFSSQAKFGLAAVPVVGQAANAAMGAFTDLPYDDRVSMSPAVSVIEGGLGTPAEVYQSLVEGESFNKGDTRDALNLLGVLTGTPTGVLAKPVGYGVGVAQGDIEPTGPLDAARGFVTGAPSPESKQ